MLVTGGEDVLTSSPVTLQKKLRLPVARRNWRLLTCQAFNHLSMIRFHSAEYPIPQLSKVGSALGQSFKVRSGSGKLQTQWSCSAKVDLLQRIRCGSSWSSKSIYTLLPFPPSFFPSSLPPPDHHYPSSTAYTNTTSFHNTATDAETSYINTSIRVITSPPPSLPCSTPPCRSISLDRNSIPLCAPCYVLVPVLQPSFQKPIKNSKERKR